MEDGNASQQSAGVCLPDITTPREYRDYTVSSIKTQGADLELAIALGMNPMQMGIMPGGN